MVKLWSSKSSLRVRVLLPLCLFRRYLPNTYALIDYLDSYAVFDVLLLCLEAQIFIIFVHIFYKIDFYMLPWTIFRIIWMILLYVFYLRKADDLKDFYELINEFKKTPTHKKYWFIKREIALWRTINSHFDEYMHRRLFIYKWRLLSFTKYIPLHNIFPFRLFIRLDGKNGGYRFKEFPKNLDFLKSFKTTFLVGLKSFWKGVRFWIIPIIIVLCVCYYSMVIRCLPFNKITFIWGVVAMIAYWLLSGFVFFIKKYQFSKFTSAIQRFWRRSYILFWLIEFSLFSVFFYLTLNANNESWYMYDQLQVFKTGFFSWRSFLPRIYPLIGLMVVGYILLISLKWNLFSKHLMWLGLLTLILLYVVWCEFYQFFHVVNFYGNFNWMFDGDEKIWSLELENRKTRTINHYIMLMIMLKFWHIVFIFIIWVFFLLRCFEVGRVRYPLFSANIQNFLILYLFAWVTMFPWIKFILRKYLDMPYYWFYINNRRLGYRSFFNDISVYYYATVNFIYSVFSTHYNCFRISFFYWSLENEFFSIKKNILKNFFISFVNN